MNALEMNTVIFVPNGVFASDPDDAAIAARRRALAAALRSGDDVVVTPSGEVEFKDEAEEAGHTAIQVPSGKLADWRG
jgi:hypothetical protein